MTRSSKPWAALGASLLALAAADPAWAQDTAVTAAAPEPESSGDIVVTAQRREQGANTVPMSIAAFSGRQLETLHITSVQDLSAIVPGFSVTPTSQGVPNYYLRGIGFNTINQSATSTVGTYVDEVAYPFPLMNSGPVYDLERVEVLKGPQGTLFGRNTTAGLINFVTGKPSDHFQGRLSGELGNYSTHNLEGMLTGPLADWLQARLAFRTEDSDDGWQKSLSRSDTQGEVHKYGIRASFAAQPAAGLTIDLSYNFWLNKSDTQAGQMIAFAPAYDPAIAGSNAAFNVPGLAQFFAAHTPTSAADADWAPYATRSATYGVAGQPGYAPGIGGRLAEDSRFHAVKLKIGYDLSDAIELVSLSSYNRLERKALTDISGAPYEITLQKANATIDSISQEVRLQGKTKLVDWLVGGYYGHDKLHDANIPLTGDLSVARLLRVLSQSLVNTPINVMGYTAAQAATTFREYVDYGDFTTTTWSVFASGDWKLTPRLTLTTGVRYTRDKQDYVGCTRDYMGNLLPHINLFNRNNWSTILNLPPATPITTDQCGSYIESTNSFGAYVSKLSEDNVSFRAAGSWQLAEHTMLYASVSRGAKAANTPVTGATRAEQNKPAKQEILTAYEGGIKAGLFDRRMQLNVAGFYYDYKDKQAVANFRDPVYTVLTQLQNIDKSEAYGIDGDLTVRVGGGLTAIASGTWLRTRILEWKNAIGSTGLPIDPAGQGFAFAPEFSGSGTLLYDRPVTARLAVTGALNARYQGDTTASSTADPLYAIPAYTLVNASLGLRARDDAWKLSAWVHNLGDTYYWGQVTSNSNTVIRFAGQPRTYGLTLGVSF